MFFLDEVGKFKKILVLQYRLFLFRIFVTEMIKQLMDVSEQLVNVKLDSKEDLEINIKRGAKKVTNTYLHNLIQLFGISKIDQLPSNRITASNLALNESIIFMKELETEASEELEDSDLLEKYFFLDKQDARIFSESFTYLAVREKSPNKISTDPNILLHTQQIFEILKKIGNISNDRNKSYSKKTYLKLIGFLLYEYMTDSSFGAMIKTIYQKLEASLKKNPSETFKLLSLFFSQKAKFRNISEILTKDRAFYYLDRDLAPDLVILGNENSSEIQQEISKTLNKVEKIADISEAVEQVLYSAKNPYQLLFKFFKPDLLQKINIAIQYREESSKIMPQIQRKDIDHILELYRNMYEGEYWLLLGFLICIENIIHNGSFNEKHILTENSIKKREKMLVKLNPANHSLILFNNYVKPRHADAHNKVSYSKDLKEIHIRGESTILKIDDLEHITRENAKMLLTSYSFIDFFEVFISNFII